MFRQPFLLMTAQNAADRASEDAANLLLRLGAAIAFVATPALQLISQRAIFILPPIAAALFLTAGAVLAPRLSARQIFGLYPSPVGLSAAFFGFWMALSLAWTPYPAEAAPRLIKAVLTLLAILPVAASLPERTRTANLYFLPLGVALTAAGALILSTPPFLPAPHASLAAQAGENLAIGVETALLLLWPALAATQMRQRAALSIGVAIVTLAAAMLVPAPIALAANAVAALVFWAAIRRPAAIGRIAGWIAAAVVVFAPAAPWIAELLGPAGATPGVWAGLAAWRDRMAQDGLRLFLGHGFNFVSSGFWRGYLPILTPHSALYEIWTDLGLIGALAAAVLVKSSFCAAGEQTDRIAPYGLAALTYVFMMGAAGAGTTQAWWITSLTICLLAFALLLRGDYKTSRPTAPRES